ncbi:MAG: TIR domain-containing protein [Sulfurimonas sp.]|nr:TIR domain-containing protein [Sulfurimonas sp.]
MIVTIVKEKNVDVNIKRIIEILNNISNHIKFNTLDIDITLNDNILNQTNSIENFADKVETLTEQSNRVILISEKKYSDNFFFHSISKYYVLSLFNIEMLTTYSKNTVSFFYIIDIIALHVDNSFRHHDDGEKKCIYCFRQVKKEIHDSIQSATICEMCQDRIMNISRNKELITNDIIDLLDELKNSNSYPDIVEYWKASQKEQVKIFFSYAHKDREYLDDFKEYIKIFERNNLVERWDDNELIVGEKWDNTIKDKIYSADIIIFLLSSTSLASDYIYNNELKIAFELNDMDEAYVVPIIIKDCLWDMTEFKEFQILPLDGKAVNSWNKKEEAWTSVSRGLKKAIDNIIRAKQNSLKSIYTAEDKDDKKVTKSDSDKEIVLKFLQAYSRWWFNIPRIINWGSERNGFGRLKNISISKLESILDEMDGESIKSKASTKNKNSRLYKIKEPIV